ncbi:MAG TPA: T9SS type A sorting domain-containing protein [Candidatus Kapabacteria bacterium]|nr:T9SS type A sorting domain-containing protein [Candidatus Kapabacteria bacterium]
MKRSYRVLAAAIIALIGAVITAHAQVPAEWVTAKSELTSRLNDIYAAAQARWDGQPHCSAFAGNLLLANSNRGYQLFSQTPPGAPNAPYQNALLLKIDTMIMAYAKLGYTAVDITIQYPVLVPSFPNSAGYLSFYRRVYALARRRGMKIIEGCEATFVDTTFGEKYLARDVEQYYFNPDGNAATNDSLTGERYRHEKLQMLQVIADSLRPDYLTVENEPVTQETNMSHLVDFSPASVAGYVKYFTDNLRHDGILIGTGAGSWDNLQYFRDAAASNVDYLDYHIYPVNLNEVDDAAFVIDSIAKQSGKRIVIGEAWCYKLSNAELLSGTDPVATAQKVFARDVFDYWQDVDQLFVKAMVKLAQGARMDMVSLFWSTYMFGQIRYDSATFANLTPAQTLAVGNEYAYQRLFAMTPSPLGLYARDAIAGMCTTSSVRERGTALQETILTAGPAGTLTVTRSDTDDDVMTVEVIDMLGAVVGAGSAGPGERSLVIAEPLATGAYLVRIRRGASAEVRKLIVTGGN